MAGSSSKQERRASNDALGEGYVGVTMIPERFRPAE